MTLLAHLTKLPTHKGLWRSITHDAIPPHAGMNQPQRATPSSSPSTPPAQPCCLRLRHRWLFAALFSLSLSLTPSQLSSAAFAMPWTTCHVQPWCIANALPVMLVLPVLLQEALLEAPWPDEVLAAVSPALHMPQPH